MSGPLGGIFLTHTVDWPKQPSEHTWLHPYFLWCFTEHWFTWTWLHYVLRKEQ